MTEPVLSLGGVTFQVIEQPDKLPLGGVQTLVENKFPGGAINIQELGAFENDIQFTGTFWYEGALSRAQALDTMRIQGNEVLLKWGSIARYVEISEFKYDVYNAEWVDYSITLKATRSSDTAVSAGANPVQALPSLSSLINTNQPATSTSVTASGTASTTAPTQSIRYRVVDGDTLFGIAKKFLGDGGRFPEIASDNQIENPNLIETGKELLIRQP